MSSSSSSSSASSSSNTRNIASGSGTGREETIINFQPHFNTITKAGEARYTHLAFAVTEFIDNSIQACKDIDDEDRKISVDILNPGGNHSSCYMVIRDNGIGMDKNGITSFATYALGIKERGLEPDTNDIQSRQGFLSKFGVGAITAGFYIGSRIKLITKMKNEEKAHEFVFDEVKFEERNNQNNESQQQNNNNVYCDKLVTRDLKDTNDLTEEESKIDFIVNMITNEEITDHYTAVIIKIRPKRVKDFINDEGQYIASMLSHTYYYYLNPTSLPNNDNNNNNNNNNNVPPSYDIKVTYHRLNKKSNFPYDLKEAITVEQLFLRQTKNSIRFRNLKPYKFKLKYKVVDEEQGNLCNAYTSNTQYEEVIKAKYLPIEGVIYYFPFNGSRETRPTQRLVLKKLEKKHKKELKPDITNELSPGGSGSQSTGGGSRANSSQQQQQNSNIIDLVNSSDESSDDDDDDGDRDESDFDYYQNGKKSKHAFGKNVHEPVFEIFWANKLIPDEKAVNFLPFFPDLKKLKAQIRDQLPYEDFTGRIKGMLFFDRDFPVSSCKQKMLLEPDLETALNNPAATATNRKEDDKFLKWLIDCHQYDKDIIFFDKEHQERRDDCFKIYRGVEFHGNKAEHVIFRTGDKVVLTKKKPHIFGEIVSFKVEENRKGYIVGQKMIMIKQYPLEEFGNKTVEFPFKYLTPEKESLLDDAVWAKKQKQWKAQIPSKLAVFINGQTGTSAEIKKSTPSDKIKRLDQFVDDDEREIVVGNVFSQTVVQLLNGQNDALIPKGMTISQSFQIAKDSKKHFLSTQSSQKSSQESITNDIEYMTFTNRLPEFDTSDGKSSIFPHFLVKKSGKYDLMYKIENNFARNKKLVVESYIIPIYVKPGKPISFEMSVEGNSRPYPMADGIILPEFTLIFEDEFKNLTGSNKLSIRIMCNDFEVKCRTDSVPDKYIIKSKGKGKKRKDNENNRNRYYPFCLVEEENDIDYEDGLHFPKGCWVAYPEKDCLLGDSNKLAKEKEFNLQIEVEELPSSDAFISIQVEPGAPCHLALADNYQNFTETKYENDSVLPEFIFNISDANMNRTAPNRFTDWLLHFEEETGDLDIVFNKRKKGKSGALQFDNKGQCVVTDLQLSGHFTKKEETFILKAVVENKDGDSVQSDFAPPSLDIPITLVQRATPTELKLYWKGEEMPAKSKHQAGITLKDLQVKLFDQAGQEMFFDVDKQFGNIRDTGIICSWDKSKKPESALLPHIQNDLIIDQKAHTNMDLFVTCQFGPFYNGSALTFPFTIKVIPNDPVRWMIPKIGDVEVGDDSALMNQISHGNGISLADRYDNQIKFDWNNMQKPDFTINSELSTTDNNNDNTTLTFIPHNAKLLLNKKEGTFCFKNIALIGNPQRVCFTVNSEGSRYASDEAKFSLVPGKAARGAIASETLGFNYQEKPKIGLNLYKNIGNIKVKFFDAGGNVPKSSECLVQIKNRRTKEDIFTQHYKIGKKELIVKKLERFVLLDDVGEEINPSEERSSEIFDFYLNNKRIGTQLELEVVATNRVCDLAFGFDKRNTALSQDDSITEWKNNEMLCLPNLTLEYITEDGEPFTSVRDALTFNVEFEPAITKSRKSKTRNLDFNTIYSITETEAGIAAAYLEFTCKPDFQFEVGEYKLDVTFNEDRSMFNYLPVHKKEITSNSFSFRITPGNAVNIGPLNAELLKHLSATNRPDKEDDRMLCEKPIYFVGFDDGGNETILEDPVSVTIESADKNVSKKDMPQLENCDSDGVLLCKMDEKDGQTRYYFPSIKLKKGSGSRVGKYFLIFSDHSDEHMQCRFEFDFSTDVERLRAIEEVNKQIEPLEAYINNLLRLIDTYDEAQQNAKTAIGNIREELKSMPLSYRLFQHPNSQDLTQHSNDGMIHYPEATDVIDRLNQLRREKQEVEEQETTLRKAKYPQSDFPPSLARLQHIGKCIELGYIQNERMSKLLAFHARGNLIRAIYVKEQKQQVEAKKDGLRAFSKEALTSFQIYDRERRRYRERNRREIESCKLPMESFTDVPGNNVPGNPRYAVNLVELPEDHEGLRDTLFYNIFMNTVVMQDVESANQYRKNKIAQQRANNQKQFCPQIICEDGTLIKANGIMEGFDLNMVDRFQYGFGEMGCASSKSYKSLVREIDFLTDLIEHLEILKENSDLKLEKIQEREPEQVKLNKLRGQLRRINAENDENDSNTNNDHIPKKKKRPRIS